jgi:hypothetical protein
MDYESLSDKEREIVDNLRKFKSSSEFRSYSPRDYYKINRHYRYLCEIAWNIKKNKSIENKRVLLEMAKRGEGKPNKKHKLGAALSSYIMKSQGSYDSEFTDKLKELRPDWFEDTAKTNKDLIIEMARNGESKPHWKKHKLGGVFSSYISESNSSFDLEFTNVIKELRPDWFEDTSKTNKDLIIEMAKRGEGRPNQKKHKLGAALSNYNNEKGGSFDSEFTDKLKELVPDWFEDTQEKQKRISFERMLKEMPPFVKFKEGQEWKGTRIKHIFICEKYGEFESTQNRLRNSWKKGKSGHPFNGGVKRQIKCSNGSIYNSATEAALILNLHQGVVSAICRGEKKQTRGFTFFYCDEEGSKVE